MRRIYKERFDKKISGVCGGLAQYLQVDSSIIRMLYLLVSVLTGGIFILVYFILALMLPRGPKSYIEAKYRKLYRSRRDRRISGICGGLGLFLKIDSNILRFIFIFATFLGFFPIFLAYLVGAIIIPLSPNGDH